MNAPIELRLLAGGGTMAITWEDGRSSRLDARLLRANSRAASAVRAAIDGAPVLAGEPIQVTDIQFVGSYAVQLSFSDGHDRGIYPWSFLFNLADVTV